MMKSEPISRRLLSDSILQALDNLSEGDVVKIRDKCNELIIKFVATHHPRFQEPEEFRAWKVKHF